MTGFLLLAVAAVLLVSGAELFVENAVGAAGRLGVTVLAVGILLAGAEPEELITAAVAAGRGRPGLAAGDAIGANITMLTACLGLAALIRPLHLGRRVRQYAVLAAAAGLLAWLVLRDGSVTRLEGGALVAAYVGLVAAIWWREREPPALGELAEVDGDDHEARAPAAGLVLAVVGIALMAVGGDVAVRGAVRVVESLGRSDSAVGLTILALATTAELFAIVWAAVRHDVPELAVAGIVGSAVYNATATLGVAALVAPLRDQSVTRPALLAAALPLAVLALARGARLGRAGGALLVAGYLLYVVLVLA